ncbi:MAG: right-handed parallel beta-helix repeat-containing protein [Spirochaetaceae bacterium]|nr:right-handed parallel beta-helix repeat-containing protein [Myxococcales bacterium]MCB9726612.1 right-handed parallel beta-helix repeat-containing protein [Spirochaetaceae bacterium]
MPRIAASALVIQLATTALLAGGAAASDGVLELNHACATTTGCVSGDAPGYPITLDGAAGRSYRLTSDLRVPMATHGIVIGHSGTTLDLGGFTIAQACTWPSPGGGTQFCLRNGEGDGIRTTSNVAIEGVQVRHGTVHFMGGKGVFLGPESIVDSVVVRESGDDGIYVGTASVVTDCIVEENDGWGVFGGGTLTRSTARGNTTGLHWQGTISHNQVSQSAIYGIQASSGSVITHNSVTSSDTAGINCNRDCRIADNAVRSSGTGSTDYGIECRGGCSVSDNMVQGSGGWGIKLWDPEASYRGNTVSDSGVGSIDGGFDLGHNACDGALCP